MTERLRGRRGVEQRKRRLARTHGLCEWCMAKGVTALASQVDHIVPLSQGGADIDENTRNLCDRHHRDATAKQFGQRVRVAIGPDGWAVT
jgi:5-methylcytosine-specific restriction enzyme A